MNVLGIGNAIVDVVCKINDEFLIENELTKSTMKLVDESEFKKLLSNLKIEETISGGSVANSIVGLSQLGNKVGFIGKVNKDDLGQKYVEGLIKEKVKFHCKVKTETIPTGTCLILITPDSERTMCTFLGTAGKISEKDIDEKVIEQSEITFLEGYLWDNENAKKAMKKMVDICKADNQQIAFTLSDLFCVDRHRDSFKELIENDVDILFANEDEIKAQSEETDFDNAIEYAKSLNMTVAITRAEKGSVIVEKDNIIEINPIQVDKVVDTTGAGDLYAAGLLFGIARGKDISTCGNYASVAAAEIISHYGARPLVKLSNLI